MNWFDSSRPCQTKEEELKRVDFAGTYGLTSSQIDDLQRGVNNFGDGASLIKRVINEKKRSGSTNKLKEFETLAKKIDKLLSDPVMEDLFKYL